MVKEYTNSNLLRGVVGTIVLSCTPSACPASSHAITLSAECAIMSAHSYQENLEEGDPVVVYDGQSSTPHTLQGWTVGKIFQGSPTKKKQTTHGYKRVLCVNSMKPQEAPRRAPTISQRVARMRTPLAPPTISFFVGREKLLDQLNKAYQNKTDRIVQLLAGPGGMGKTQLATSLYHTLQEEYTYAFWLSAESKDKLTSA